MNLGLAMDVYSRLVFYDQVTKSAPAGALHQFMSAAATGQEMAVQYLAVVRSLYALGPSNGPTGDAWRDHLIERILEADNPFTRGAKAGVVTPEMVEAAAFDLRQLQQLFGFTAETCRRLVAEPGLPAWAGWPVGGSESTGDLKQTMGMALAGAADWGELAPELGRYYAEGRPE